MCKTYKTMDITDFWITDRFYKIVLDRFFLLSSNNGITTHYQAFSKTLREDVLYLTTSKSNGNRLKM